MIAANDPAHCAPKLLNNAAGTIAQASRNPPSSPLSGPAKMQSETVPPPPTVSLLMPAYNAAAFISAAIASAQSQSLAALEIIVIDDASTDDTARIVQTLAAQDPRIRYERLPTNAGPAAARNRGLALARAPWIALLDADDRYAQNRLEALVTLAGQHNADIVSDHVVLCPENGGDPLLVTPPDAEPMLMRPAAYIEGCICRDEAQTRDTYAFMKPIFRREFVQAHAIAYNELSRNGEDFQFCVDCLLAGAVWWVTPQALYLYTVRGDSLTATLSREDQRRLVDRSRTLSRDALIRRDPALATALNRHWRNIAPIYYYYSFRDALKAANLTAALRLLTRDRSAAMLIAGEFARRIPAIAARLAGSKA